MRSAASERDLDLVQRAADLNAAEAGTPVICRLAPAICHRRKMNALNVRHSLLFATSFLLHSSSSSFFFCFILLHSSSASFFFILLLQSCSHADTSADSPSISATPWYLQSERSISIAGMCIRSRQHLHVPRIDAVVHDRNVRNPLVAADP